MIPRRRFYWERMRLQAFPEGESLCEASHLHSTDINNIIERHTRHGGIPPPTQEPIYEDVVQLQTDLMTRINFSASTIEAVQGFLDARAAEPAIVPEDPAPPA